MEQHLIELEVEKHRLVAIAGNPSKPGPPIIFLHGITASIHFWPPSLPAEIRQNYPWYSLSLPGHFPAIAPEDFGPARVTPEMFAQVLGTAIGQLVGNQPVMVVGHSTGAFAALLLAALRPQQIRSVLCISGFYQGAWTGLFGFLQKLACGPLPGRLLFKGILRFGASNSRRYRIASALNAANRRAYFKASVLSETLEPMRLDAARHNLDHLLYLFAGLREMDIGPLLQKIQAPLAVVAGEQDPLIPMQQALAIAQEVPNTTLTLLPGVGHMFFAECTETYQKLLVDWLMTEFPSDPSN